MEFNTLLNVDTIKQVILEGVEKKRKNPPKLPCKLEDIPKLRRVSQKNKNRLSKFVSRIRSGRYSTTEARKDIDKSTDTETITEERTVDLEEENKETDGSLNASSRLQRKVGMTKRSPRPLRKTEEETTENTESSSDLPDGAKRDIPGRRRPRQPDFTWQDTKCNSIDEGDEDNTQFFTAVG